MGPALYLEDDEDEDEQVWIAIPGSRILGSRLFFSIPNPGIVGVPIPGYRD